VVGDGRENVYVDGDVSLEGCMRYKVVSTVPRPLFIASDWCGPPTTASSTIGSGSNLNRLNP